MPVKRALAQRKGALLGVGAEVAWAQLRSPQQQGGPREQDGCAVGLRQIPE